MRLIWFGKILVVGTLKSLSLGGVYHAVDLLPASRIKSESPPQRCRRVIQTITLQDRITRALDFTFLYKRPPTNIIDFREGYKILGPLESAEFWPALFFKIINDSRFQSASDKDKYLILENIHKRISMSGNLDPQKYQEIIEYRMNFIQNMILRAAVELARTSGTRPSIYAAAQVVDIPKSVVIPIPSRRIPTAFRSREHYEVLLSEKLQRP